MAAKQLSDGRPDGTTLGQGATDLIAFHGGTPTSQRASAALSSTHSVFVHTGVSLVANNSVSVVMGLVVSVLNELRSVVVGHSLHKGGA
ncbi:MAG: hypothetical protein KIT32_12340 [Rhodocyclaceae bacterium]|nr:hypothetical protein [Rhodocyclaceae bacterium]